MSIDQQKARTHTAQVWEALKATSLAIEDKRDIGLRYLDFLVERSDDISAIYQIEIEVHREYVDKAPEESRKRGLEDDSNQRPIKQLRSDSVSMQSPATPAPPAPYYPTQQPVGYNPYAAYQGYGAGYYGAAPAAGTPQQSWDYSQQAAVGY